MSHTLLRLYFYLHGRGQVPSLIEDSCELGGIRMNTLQTLTVKHIVEAQSTSYCFLV